MIEVKWTCKKPISKNFIRYSPAQDAHFLENSFSSRWESVPLWWYILTFKEKQESTRKWREISKFCFWCMIDDWSRHSSVLVPRQRFQWLFMFFLWNFRDMLIVIKCKKMIRSNVNFRKYVRKLLSSQEGNQETERKFAYLDGIHSRETQRLGGNCKVVHICRQKSIYFLQLQSWYPLLMVHFFVSPR